MTEPISSKEYKLDVESELRFEIESKDVKVTVEVSIPRNLKILIYARIFQLKLGSAELFGTELVKGKAYEFHTGAKVAIFTYRGCTLEVRGETDVIYISRETPMIQYLNCHAALEQMREKAEEDDLLGPIAMIVGPTDVGKSTLCKILLNYAARMNRRPLYCDIDVGQGALSVPGMIASILVERPASLTEGFSQSAPLVYHQGHRSPGENNALYKMIVKKMAEVAITSREANKGCEYIWLFIYLDKGAYFLYEF